MSKRSACLMSTKTHALTPRLTGYDTRDVLCMPVVNRDGEVTGVIYCINQSSGSFDEDDERLPPGICTHVLVVLQSK